MRFRTEIELVKGSFEIRPDTRVALIGSCFADEIRESLSLDGIHASGGKMGPLFNPSSILRIINRGKRLYSTEDLVCHEGVWHCLDWAARYQDTDSRALLDTVNRDYAPLAEDMATADVIIITFGNTKIFETPFGVAGNCHRLPADYFTSRRLALEEIVESWTGVNLPTEKVILTVSPVRYTENGLAESSLAKAILRVAVERICNANGWDYFPAFEILNDDLRDYRFYNPDLKHPSAMAVDYVYEKFCDAYMSAETRRVLASRRKEALTRTHYNYKKNL